MNHALLSVMTQSWRFPSSVIFALIQLLLAVAAAAAAAAEKKIDEEIDLSSKLFVSMLDWAYLFCKYLMKEKELNYSENRFKILLLLLQLEGKFQIRSELKKVEVFRLYLNFTFLKLCCILCYNIVIFLRHLT